ncbi:MAG: beta-ketoacyl-[acyl-carrier-protein] synthase family protein, partial [Salinivirgaceae bacterium]|nr:beta-ketoacyl-[acyl-carrier-protein] synthase family protein [Salinivirgaceae bacterium]
MKKRVVITGMGIYSCIGKNLDEVRESLYNGKSGIVFDPERKEMGFRSALTAYLEKPDLKGVLSRNQRVYMPEQAMYAYVATAEALKNAKIDQDYLDRNVVGLMYGNDSSADPVVKAVDTMRAKKDTTLVGSGAIFQSMNSTVTMNLSCIFKLRGINLTVSGACASGSHAIGLGALLISNGLQDMVVCGGAQEVNPFSIGSFDGISAFSTRESDPTKATRPFDRDRDGLVPGGGAATVIIEEYEHAVKRGAPILAEILSYGFSSNGDHISTPNVAGPTASLEMAIKLAGIDINEIGYINAHATSTPVGDAQEAKAIYNVFGDRRIEVTSTKSQTGHEMWMAGASEVIYSMLMMKNEFIAANINFENPDEDSAKLLIPDK